MIGQKNLLDKIDKLTQNGFPRFTLLVGPKGSGKKLISREIANKLGYPLVPVGIGVDEVREVIVNSYRNTEPIVYILPDTDKMSVAAKNALLKITEEPPQKAYFILTVTDLSNTLQTLISRACTLKMDSYTQEELHNYLTMKYDVTNIQANNIVFVINTATVPEEVDTLMGYDIKEFRVFVETVATNLHTVSAANSFKILNKLALKKDEDKWDVLLFVQALRDEFFRLYWGEEQPSEYYFRAYSRTCDLLKELKYKNSVNRQYCLDQFILDVRKYWRELQ
jgi:replication-associated recombination protein RarA